MRLAKVQFADGQKGVIAIDKENQAHRLNFSRSRYHYLQTLSDLLFSDDPETLIQNVITDSLVSLEHVKILPPIDKQEVWAAGVTYKRSKVAREEESAGAAQFYDLVYKADRPELFLKSTPERVIGHRGTIRIRKDATWSVPEPELTLMIDPQLRIVGYTVGNDVSSRDIEGANPLYLPQAKIYDGSCAVGPYVVLTKSVPQIQNANIKLVIQRDKRNAFEGKTSVSQMARSLTSLVEWLGKEYSFPDGALLMTGTGIVPPDNFTLQLGDIVEITIDGIGTLSNTVG